MGDKYKGLKKRFHRKYVREFVDIDYADKLSDEDKEWLANFLDNYYGGVWKSDDEKNVMPSSDKREMWRNNHARRRDISNIMHKIEAEEITYYDDKDKEELFTVEVGVNQIKITLDAPPFSINKAYYLKSFGGKKATKVRTQECRNWGDSILLQLKKYVKKFDKFRNGFDPKTQQIHLEITHTIPEKTFYTKDGEVSVFSNDLSNVEKMPIDLVFDKRFNGRMVFGEEISNLDLNDKYITKMVSKKVPGEEYKIEIVIKVKDI